MMGIGLAVALLGPAVGTGQAAAAAATVSVPAHWGSFFGANDGFHDTIESPASVALPGTVAEVASSNSTEYALLTNGTVYAWGMGNEGQLGDGGTVDSYGSAVQVDFPAGVVIASLPTDAMPYDTGLAIDTAGHAWGWGINAQGALCLGNATPQLTPVELPFSDVTAVAGAGDHGLYDSDHTVYACGGNHQGDLGIGSTTASSVPMAIRALGHHVVQLVASFNNSGALLSNGTYLDWGTNNLGQLGDSNVGVTSTVPVAVSLPARVVKVVQGGSDADNGQTLVLLSNGSLYAWGDGEFGQLGTGSTANQPSPTPFAPPPGVTYADLATGGGTSYAISTTGAVYSWGSGSQGQVGNGNPKPTLEPVRVASGATEISSTAQNVVVS
jgi:alpha-tubulin suppressor-like RCC1 family protein